jgi:hypothetical protein
LRRVYDARFLQNTNPLDLWHTQALKSSIFHHFVAGTYFLAGTNNTTGTTKLHKLEPLGFFCITLGCFYNRGYLNVGIYNFKITLTLFANLLLIVRESASILPLIELN